MGLSVIDGHRARLDTRWATMAAVRTERIIADIPLLVNAPMPLDATASRDTAAHPTTTRGRT